MAAVIRRGGGPDPRPGQARRPPVGRPGSRRRPCQPI